MEFQEFKEKLALAVAEITGGKVTEREAIPMTHADYELSVNGYYHFLVFWANTYQYMAYPANIALGDFYRSFKRTNPEIFKPEYRGREQFELTNEKASLQFAEWCLRNVRPLPENYPNLGKYTVNGKGFSQTGFVPNIEEVFRIYMSEMCKTLKDLPT